MRIDYPNCEIDIDEYVEFKKSEIEKEIDSLSTNYIINVDENKYIHALADKYWLEMTVYYETMKVVNIKYTDAEYKFCIKYKFTGDIDILRIKPNNYIVHRPIPIEIVGDELWIYFTLKKDSLDILESTKKSVIGDAFANIEIARGQISRNYNEKLIGIVQRIFKLKKNEKEKEYRTFDELGIETNDRTDNICPINIKKKVITIPKVLSNEEVAYTVKEDVYREIIQAIYVVYKNYEKYESIYKGKKEEELRDLILPLLQTMFINTHSSGEAFNKKGKTDIQTSAPDGSSILIAECKVWYGEKKFLESINQLLKRYVTWRDNRVALIVFVYAKNIMEVIKTAKSAIENHNCYIRSNGASNESSFSYTFHIDGDVNSKISLELMFFHYPQDS